MPEFLAQLALSAVVAVLAGLLDGPLFDIHLTWWVCALIGLVVRRLVRDRQLRRVAPAGAEALTQINRYRKANQ